VSALNLVGRIVALVDGVERVRIVGSGRIELNGSRRRMKLDADLLLRWERRREIRRLQNVTKRIVQHLFSRNGLRANRTFVWGRNEWQHCPKHKKSGRIQVVKIGRLEPSGRGRNRPKVPDTFRYLRRHRRLLIDRDRSFQCQKRRPDAEKPPDGISAGFRR
jgi:hypothetical protein